ncbi:MAG: DUF2200 family protein [Bacteroides sp.]|nr:DUF2200 family protein [Bacteroides sp.]
MDTAHDRRMTQLIFADVYPLYLNKVTKKGRTEEELLPVIGWLTGFDPHRLQSLIEQRATLHPDAILIKGRICGCRVEEIENPLTRNVRYLDKLVDELAKGKKLSSILRTSIQP